MQDENKTGREMARETADKIKADVEASEKGTANDRDIALTELQQIQNNETLLKMYRENAKVGSANLSGRSPMLKVTNARKSKHTLPDGSIPHDGWFFYVPTQEEVETIDVHILSVSRGFYTKSQDKGKKNQYNQIVSGVRIDGTWPFVMYFSGKRCPSLWDFGKEANVFTHHPEFPVPLFALSINLKTHFEKNPDKTKDDSWIIDFTINKNEDGSTMLLTDQEEFLFLRNKAIEIEASVASLIEKIEEKDKKQQGQAGEEDIPMPIDPE